MLHSLKATIALAGLSAALAGQAEVVTFSPLTSTDQGPAGNGATYQETGLTFTSSQDGELFHWGTSQGTNADPTGATLYQNVVNQSLTVTLTAGGSFLLDSFDLADVFNDGQTGGIPFSYTDGSGTHSSTLTLDGAVGLQTFNFGLSLTSFTLQQVEPFFQLDNVRYNEGSSVPEPASWALVGVALLALRSASRRRT